MAIIIFEPVTSSHFVCLFERYCICMQPSLHHHITQQYVERCISAVPWETLHHVSENMIRRVKVVMCDICECLVQDGELKLQVERHLWVIKYLDHPVLGRTVVAVTVTVMLTRKYCMTVFSKDCGW
jgi:hypothetical protein